MFYLGYKIISGFCNFQNFYNEENNVNVGE